MEETQATKSTEPVRNKDFNPSLDRSFCDHCGKPVELNRIDGRYILTEIGRVVNFDKGILFTIRELLLRPGVSVRTFLLEDRNRLVKPVLFVILCSLAYTLAQRLLSFEDGYVGYSFSEESTTILMFQWISNNYGYANIGMAVFIVLWLKLFFRKYGFNFFEILILICFMMGMGMLIFAFFGILKSFIPLKVIDLGFFLGILYMAWGIARFFGPERWINYVKAFFGYMFGLFTFFICVMLIGTLIDLLAK